MRFTKGRVQFIAEISGNHLGSLSRAKDLIKEAANAGATAVKLQTYTADTMTLDIDKFKVDVKHELWGGRKLYDLYNEAYTPWEWHSELFELCRSLNVIPFSSPFDLTAVDFLESLNCSIYKIASLETSDHTLIKKVAETGKPIIISTGIAEYDDIKLAIETCLEVGNHQIVLLKCTSSYPAPIEEANMIMVKKLADEFNLLTGLSDHTIGSIVPIVSVCFGAKIIEKHFILDRSIGGPDASFSMNESEFKEMVNAVRQAELAIGKVSFELTEKQVAGKVFAKSLYIAKDLNIGETVLNEHIRSVRPGYSLHPKYLKELIGKKSLKQFTIGDRIKKEDFE